MLPAQRFCVKQFNCWMSCDLEVTNESARCWEKKCQLYNNKDCFYREPTSRMWFSVGPCCCCFIVDICYKLKCFCYSCCCSMETSCLLPLWGAHIWRQKTNKNICYWVLRWQSQVVIDTYSNKGIVQITKPWIKTKSSCSFQPTWHLSLVPFKRCVTQGLKIWA